MDMSIQTLEEKIRPSFTMDAEDHPMVEGMQPGKMYHMKVKAMMTGKEMRKDHKGKMKHHGTFEIHHAEDQTKDQSISQIMKDGADEESATHEKKESGKERKQEGE